MTPNDVNQRIASLVFLDFESTGIPAYEFKPRATEICLIAVERVHFQSLQEQNIRVQNKLMQCFYPRKRISQNSTNLTGLCNENLQNQKPMNEDFVTALCAFLKRLPAPVCLIAHNGNEFDFPLLQAEVRNVGCTLPDDILCADSYCAFRALLENLSTEVKFLQDPEKVLGVTRHVELVSGETRNPSEGHSTSAEEDESFDDDVSTELNYKYESFGFTVEYDDISSDEECVSRLSLSANGGMKLNVEQDTYLDNTSDVAKQRTASSINDQNNHSASTQDYEEILIDCDNPDCEWPECKCSNLAKHALVINNSGKSNCKLNSLNGVKNGVSVVNGHPVDNAVSLNCKNENNVSVKLPTSSANSSVESRAASLTKISLEANSMCLNQPDQNIEFTPKSFAMDEHNLEVNTLLQQDMDFVVSCILSQDFRQIEEKFEVMIRKADKTPTRPINTIPITPQRSHRCTSQTTPTLNQARVCKENEPEKIMLRVENHDKVKKRLFPVEIKSKVIAAANCLPNHDSGEPSITNPSLKSCNGVDGENLVAAYKMPSKRLCNGVASINAGQSFDSSVKTSDAHSKQYHNGVPSTNNGQVSERHDGPKNGIDKHVSNIPNASCLCDKIAVMVPAVTAQTQAFNQPPAGGSELGPSRNVNQPFQKGTQRAKYKYSLEALHELLIGSKPTISHTAEDDTEALLRLCRTKGNDFCDWIDNHAVCLNLVPPMWQQKPFVGKT